jgi:hypothetical protein
MPKSQKTQTISKKRKNPEPEKKKVVRKDRKTYEKYADEYVDQSP